VRVLKRKDRQAVAGRGRCGRDVEDSCGEREERQPPHHQTSRRRASAAHSDMASASVVLEYTTSACVIDYRRTAPAPWTAQARNRGFWSISVRRR
jgi:hypothetical protein